MNTTSPTQQAWHRYTARAPATLADAFKAWARHNTSTHNVKQALQAAVVSQLVDRQAACLAPTLRPACPNTRATQRLLTEQATTTTVLQSSGVQTATSPRQLLGVLEAPPQLPAGLLDAVSADQACSRSPLVHGYPAWGPCLHAPTTMPSHTHSRSPASQATGCQAGSCAHERATHFTRRQ